MRDQVRQLRDAGARQKRLENLLVSAYRALPQANHLDTIPGIGAVTAAVLTAFILDIDRFADARPSSSPTSASCPSRPPAASIATARHAGRDATS